MSDRDSLPWFEKWLLFHLGACPHASFPHPRTQPQQASAMFGVWRDKFESLRVMEDEAREATKHLAAAGSCFPDDHLARLCRHIIGARTDARLAAEAALRRRQSEEHTRRVDEHARLKQRWAAMSEEEREAIREEVRKEVPQVAEIEAQVQWYCLERLKERVTSTPMKRSSP